MASRLKGNRCPTKPPLRQERIQPACSKLQIHCVPIVCDVLQHIIHMRFFNRFKKERGRNSTVNV